MNGTENQTYIVLLVISNVIAILQLVASFRWPGIARFSFFLLFAWAGWINWRTALLTPEAYLEYADLAWSGWYRSFIRGWFAGHIRPSVGFVASCQLLIAVSMLLKGRVFVAGGVGAILFLLAILPLGIGAGFPCTAIMAVAIYVLIRRHHHVYAWQMWRGHRK
jgi:hypothetical protein